MYNAGCIIFLGLSYLSIYANIPSPDNLAPRRFFSHQILVFLHTFFYILWLTLTCCPPTIQGVIKQYLSTICTSLVLARHWGGVAHP